MQRKRRCGKKSKPGTTDCLARRRNGRRRHESTLCCPAATPGDVPPHRQSRGDRARRILASRLRSRVLKALALAGVRSPPGEGFSLRCETDQPNLNPRAAARTTRRQQLLNPTYAPAELYTILGNIESTASNARMRIDARRPSGTALAKQAIAGDRERCETKGRNGYL